MRKNCDKKKKGRQNRKYRNCVKNRKYRKYRNRSILSMRSILLKLLRRDKTIDNKKSIESIETKSIELYFWFLYLSRFQIS